MKDLIFVEPLSRF